MSTLKGRTNLDKRCIISLYKASSQGAQKTLIDCAHNAHNSKSLILFASWDWSPCRIDWLSISMMLTFANTTINMYYILIRIIIKKPSQFSRQLEKIIRRSVNWFIYFTFFHPRNRFRIWPCVASVLWSTKWRNFRLRVSWTLSAPTCCQKRSNFGTSPPSASRLSSMNYHHHPPL